MVVIPTEVVDHLAGSPTPGLPEAALPLLTVDEHGFPHVCLLSRAEVEADAEEVRAVIASRRTRGNLERDGRACLVVVSGTTAHYLKMQLTRARAVEDGWRPPSPSPAPTRLARHPARTDRYVPTDDLADLERWDLSAQALADLREQRDAASRLSEAGARRLGIQSTMERGTGQRDGVTAGVLVVAVSVAAGAVVQSAVGFGLGLVAVPFLALAAPELLPGPVIFAGATLAIAVMIRDRVGLDFFGVRWAMVGRVFGNIAGAALVASLPTSSLSIFFAAMVLVAIAISMSGWRVRPSTYSFIAAGTASGVMGTTTADRWTADSARVPGLMPARSCAAASRPSSSSAASSRSPRWPRSVSSMAATRWPAWR